MKRKILTLGLAITMSVHLAGCASTSSTEQSPKKSTTMVTEDLQQPTEPSAAEPTKASTEEPEVKATEDTKISGDAKAETPLPPKNPSTTTSNKVPAIPETKTPSKPALPQGTISLKVGATLPEFMLADLKGNNTSASTIITGHKLTFINFWTTTWGYCIEEMPALEGLSKKYASKNVAVIGLLLDPYREKWALQVVKETGTTFLHLKDDGRFADHIFGVPQTLIVDRSGKILDIVVGIRSLEEFSALADKHL